MKKIFKILLPIFGTLIIGGGITTGIIVNNNSKKPNSEPPIVQNEKFTLTIHYPNDTTEIIEKEKDTEIDLTIYQKNIENLTFDGFYLDTNYNNAISFNFKFTQNMNIYAKYTNIEPTHTFETNWSYDENYHYHKCIDSTCSEVSAKNAHTLIEEINEKYLKESATEEKSAMYYKHCSTCDYISEEIFEYGEPLIQKYKLSVYIYLSDEQTYWNQVYYYKEGEIIDYNVIIEDFENHINPVTNEKYSKYYEITGFVNQNNIEFNDETMFNEDIEIKAVIMSKCRTLTLDYGIIGTNNVDVLKGETITLETLKEYEIKNDNYNFIGWYNDELYENIFTELTIIDDITVYAKYELVLDIISSSPKSIDTAWFADNYYSDVDQFYQILNFEFNREVKGDTGIYLLFNNKEIKLTNIDISIINDKCYGYSDYKLTTPEILGATFPVITGYKIVAENKTFIINYEKSYDLSEFIHYSVILGENTLTSDYSKYKKHYDEFINKSAYDYVLNKNPNFLKDESLKNQFLGMITYSNIDMLEADILLYEDIIITNREEYLNSIFAYENYNGDFDLNGHSIYFNFDGKAGDTLFQNNYGNIHNGKILINGLRNSTNQNIIRNNGLLFNTITFSSAVIEGNYGVIKDIDFTIYNFGFNFDTKHNVDCVIGTNGRFALTEDCSFNLYMNYIGTKEQKILNPIATSQAGIFREILNGSQYYWYSAWDLSTEQQLSNLDIIIREINASEELQERNLVEMTYLTDEYVDFNYRIDPNIPDRFYGGAYYYDGTEYHKFTSYLGAKDYGSFVDYHPEYVSNYKEAEYYIYYKQLSSESDEYVYGKCDYGYLLPEFNIVAFDDTELLKSCDSLCEEDPFNTFTEEEKNVNFQTYGKVWFTNSSMIINCNSPYLIIKDYMIYRTTYNDGTTIINQRFATSGYTEKGHTWSEEEVYEFVDEQ